MSMIKVRADSRRSDSESDSSGHFAVPDVFRKLEALETKLGTLLGSHIQEIKSLGESLTAGGFEKGKNEKKEEARRLSNASGMSSVHVARNAERDRGVRWGRVDGTRVQDSGPDSYTHTCKTPGRFL